MLRETNQKEPSLTADAGFENNNKSVADMRQKLDYYEGEVRRGEQKMANQKYTHD